MQTFLPEPSFGRSAQILDRQRLGKQRVETLQLLNALAGLTKGWRTHPAALMWQGYERALILYGMAICDEWVRRGYKDGCKTKIMAHRDRYGPELALPPWLGDPKFHASHRSNLLRKDPAFYGRLGWPEPPTLDYIWPVARKTPPDPDFIPL